MFLFITIICSKNTVQSYLTTVIFDIVEYHEIMHSNLHCPIYTLAILYIARTFYRLLGFSMLTVTFT